MPLPTTMPIDDIHLPEPGASIWMTGIGGCGMSGLARMLAARGFHVAGSDMTDSEVTRALEKDGIDVHIGKILHPSPANPRANRDWEGEVRRQLSALGLCSP